MIEQEINTVLEVYLRLKASRWFFTRRSQAEKEALYKLEELIKRL